jgi:hypothetical protein
MVQAEIVFDAKILHRVARSMPSFKSIFAGRLPSFRSRRLQTVVLPFVSRPLGNISNIHRLYYSRSNNKMSLRTLLELDSPTTSHHALHFLELLSQFPGISRALFEELSPADAALQLQALSDAELTQPGKLRLLEYLRPLLARDDFHLPSEENTNDDVVSDLDEDALFRGISAHLGTKYLERNDENSVSVFAFKNWEEGASGFLFGKCARPIITVPVKALRCIGATPQSVHFLVSTGTRTEMSPAAFRSLLGIVPGDVAPKLWSYEIGGIKHIVKQCSPQGYHADINVIGFDFFQTIKAKVLVDFSNNSVRISGQVRQSKSA